MLSRSLVLALVLLVPSTGCSGTPEPAPPRPPESDLPARHSVRRGETLWGISERYYGTGRHWGEIVRANPEVFGPRLKVGDRLAIPAIEDE